MDFANKRPKSHLAAAVGHLSAHPAIQLPIMAPWPTFALAIVGPTATGKSALAAHLAQILHGEIVNGDAFQCYSGMAIGTAQPNAVDLQHTVHHLYGHQDWRTPSNVGQYVQQCWQVLAQVSDRQQLPIVCGGTGLYIRSLRFGLSGLPAGDPALRLALQQQEARLPGSLYQQLQQVDPIAAKRIGTANMQRIVRALEVWQQTGQPISAFWQHHQSQLGLAWPIVVLYHDLPDAVLRTRMIERIDTMWQQGWLAEVAQLQQQGITPDVRAMQAVGYREIWQVAQQELTWPKAREQIIQRTWQLIRRQRTWFRKEPYLLPWQQTWGEASAEQLRQQFGQHYRALLQHYSIARS